MPWLAGENKFGVVTCCQWWHRVWVALADHVWLQCHLGFYVFQPCLHPYIEMHVEFVAWVHLFLFTWFFVSSKEVQDELTGQLRAIMWAGQPIRRWNAFLDNGPFAKPQSNCGLQMNV